MKEIKFRAWVNNQMFYWQPSYDIGLFGILSDGAIVINEAVQVSENDFDLIQNQYKDYELMQYTGLKDKNGKEIYEGDIVKVSDYIFNVIYDNEESRFRPDNDKSSIPLNAWLEPSMNFNISEIIGNIFENKHLLDEQ